MLKTFKDENNDMVRRSSIINMKTLTYESMEKPQVRMQKSHVIVYFTMVNSSSISSNSSKETSRQ